MGKKNIVLIGFMGSGKTTVGRKLAEQTGRRFVDTDRCIEEREGMSIPALFRTKGEAFFRMRETALLRELSDAAAGDCVFAVGGGTPLLSENRELLRGIGEVVWLKVRPETVLARLAADNTRPLLSGEDKEKRIRVMMEERGAAYRDAADREICTDTADPGRIAEWIDQTMTILETGRDCHSIPEACGLSQSPEWSGGGEETQP